MKNISRERRRMLTSYDNSTFSAELAAMAQLKKKNNSRSSVQTLFNSASTSHMTPHVDRIKSKNSAHLPATLVSLLKLDDVGKGMQLVKRKTENRESRVFRVKYYFVPFDVAMILFPYSFKEPERFCIVHAKTCRRPRPVQGK